jgi:transposase InsO family protein
VPIAKSSSPGNPGFEQWVAFGGAPLLTLTQEDARRLIQQYVDHNNTVRLHSAIGFITPADMLAGKQTEIHAARDGKLNEARQLRQKRRQQAA